MTTKGKTSIRQQGDGKGIYVPADLLKDSAMPFKEDQELVIEIRGSELAVRARGKNEEI